MVKVTFAGVEVDRCASCRGIFFDQLEKERLLKMQGAGAIDIGNAKTGRTLDDVGYINCPRCGSRMLRMLDPGQAHICFEHCAACGGSFFDAGEFKDLKHHTIVDFFKDLLIKKRGVEQGSGGSAAG